MLPFSVTIPATVTQRSEFPEGLMNYPVYSDQCKKFDDMFRFKGTIIRPNMKTQYWYNQRVLTLSDPILFTDCKGKAVSLQVWSGPEDSRKLRFLDFMKTAQDGGKVVSLTHRPHLPLEIFPVLISVRG